MNRSDLDLYHIPATKLCHKMLGARCCCTGVVASRTLSAEVSSNWFEHSKYCICQVVWYTHWQPNLWDAGSRPWQAGPHSRVMTSTGVSGHLSHETGCGSVNALRTCASMLVISTLFHLDSFSYTRQAFLTAVCLYNHFLLYCLAGELSVSAFSTMLFFARFCPGFMLAGPPGVLLWSVPKPADQNTSMSLLALRYPRAGRALARKR